LNLTINIEKIVSQQLHEEDRNISWLCKKLNWDRKKIYRIFDTGDILVSDLQKLSILVKYDFFQSLSKDFNSKTSLVSKKQQ
jgi:hypothetical protein